MTATPPHDALRALWLDAGLPAQALELVRLEGTEPALPSSFAVGTAAQASIAAAALAAAAVGRGRGGPTQTIAVDLRDAALEACGRFAVDGVTPEAWDRLAGLYRCAGGAGTAGWVRVHTNFAHHRDRLLRLLGVLEGPAATREQVAEAIATQRGDRLEDAAAAAGALVAALRDFEAWDAHPQAAADARAPLVEIERIGDAPPLSWPTLAPGERPLSGLRVVELTRVLAGPVAGRTLAAYGADVMLVNAPHLPNIDAIADTSRGKRSAHADLRDAADRARFAAVLADAHVYLQSYRPGGLAGLGFGADDATRLRPGIVCASLSAYGRAGPWADRRGFDSLVQAGTGFNLAEADAAGDARPRALPMQILDMASGFLLAFGIGAALLHQRASGGSWHVRVSLSRTGRWLRSLGRVDAGFAAPNADFAGRLETSASGYGRLEASPHSARFSATPARYGRPSMPPGSDRLDWR